MIITSFQYNLEEVIDSNIKFKGAYHLLGGHANVRPM